MIVGVALAQGVGYCRLECARSSVGYSNSGSLTHTALLTRPMKSNYQILKVQASLLDRGVVVETFTFKGGTAPKVFCAYAHPPIFATYSPIAGRVPALRAMKAI